MKGETADPLYRWLTDTTLHPKTGGDVKWNFQKYLVDHRGKVIAMFEPREDPLGEKFTAALDAALKARGPYEKKPEVELGADGKPVKKAKKTDKEKKQPESGADARPKQDGA